ncbi:hypothetical protein V6N11_006736 [Hibiscus sabdariffa]|uniref:Uncharacterized protein n=1 Tax=Hibiscus sabdariffa TaxID=183260 RepID=A0ABR2RSG4_9ROSI
MQRHVLVPLAKGLQFSWLKYYGTDHSSWQPQASCCSTCHGIYLRLQIFFIFFFSCQSKYFITIFKLAILLLIGCHGWTVMAKSRNCSFPPLMYNLTDTCKIKVLTFFWEVITDLQFCVYRNKQLFVP